MPNRTPRDLAALEQFAATDEERTLIEHVNQWGVKPSARRLGLDFRTVQRRLDRIARRAAERNHAPDFGREPPRAPVLPPTERVKGVSTLRDGAGAIEHEWTKTERATDAEEVDRAAPLLEAPVVAQSIMRDSQGDRRITWERRAVERQTDVEIWARAMAEHVAKYRGAARRTKRGTAHVGLQRGLLEVYVWGDPHIGMHAWGQETRDRDYNLKICAQENRAAFDLLTEQAKAASHALLINVGDAFHANDETQLTPGHKHKLDVDSRVAKISETGFGIVRYAVDSLLRKHDHVTVWNIAGNHDPLLALMLNTWIAAIYENEPRVSVPSNAPAYLDLVFGANFIGACHGHLAKDSELPGIYLVDRPAEVGASKFRHVFSGHIHHERLVELAGWRVEHVRTLAPRDAYSATRFRSGQSITAVTFHERFGLIARREVGIDLVLARLAGDV